jgi:hypothetical protein
MNENEIKQLFMQFPEAKKLYQDSRGGVWTQRKSAEAQSINPDSVKVFKRTDYITKKVENDSENNN